jgi:hypothetical protein
MHSFDQEMAGNDHILAAPFDTAQDCTAVDAVPAADLNYDCIRPIVGGSTPRDRVPLSSMVDLCTSTSTSESWIKKYWWVILVVVIVLAAIAYYARTHYRRSYKPLQPTPGQGDGDVEMPSIQPVSAPATAATAAAAAASAASAASAAAGGTAGGTAGGAATASAITALLRSNDPFDIQLIL